MAIYNELTAFRIVRGSLSIDRLLNALRFVLNKHAVLHTSLIFNNETGILQHVLLIIINTFILTNEQTFENENELQNIIYQTTINPDLFDLSNGRVFHCQILQQQKLISENNNNELITNSDVLIIAFHHASI